MEAVTEATWAVYIVRCGDGSLYCGVSTDVERRMKDHGGARGARYVRAHGGIAALLWMCPASSRSVAQRIEAWVKGLRRDAKLKLASGGMQVPDSLLCAR